MNCEEFRSQYNMWLDGRKSSPLSGEAELHARICAACGAYVRAIARIDAGLQDIQDVPLPEEILAFSLKPGGGTPGWGRRLSSIVQRGVPFGLSALAAWIITLCLPPPWQFALQSLLASGAMVLFAVASLRPMFVD